MKEDEEEVRSRWFLHKGFIGSMEYWVCFCATSLVKRKDVKRRNGDMIELRKQRVLLDVRGIVFAVV